MIIQEITGLAEKLYLMMEVDKFRELLPGIPLAPAEKNDSALDHGAAGPNRVFGNHRIATDQDGGGHCFFTFDSGKLTFYEINAQFDYSESNYMMLTDLFSRLLPLMTGHYGEGKTISPLQRFSELDPVKLPADGYPCDRYIIGAMRQWEEGGKSVSLSFALAAPGYFFFQLRAVLLA